MTFSIAFLPGDGVGPEVAGAARRVLEAVSSRFDVTFEFNDALFGGAAIDAMGTPLPTETKEICLHADAVFLGAVGGPKWDGGAVRPEAGLLELRQMLGVFANLRPIQIFPDLENLSPLKPEIASGTEILIIRELTGGLYFGARQEGDEEASDSCVYTREEIERIAHIAFRAARGRRGRVVSVDKANVLATSRLWRKTVNALHAAAYQDIELAHVLVDAAAMKLLQAPSQFDVILTENLFGDILSDEASVIPGSIGLAPSASLGEGRAGLFEPIHGSAPDIAGQDKANPAGAILSAAMMLRHCADAPTAADAIDEAVKTTIRDGVRTQDLGGGSSCSDFAAAVCMRLDA